MDLFYTVYHLSGSLESRGGGSTPQLVLSPAKPSIKLLTFSHCEHILQLLHLLYVADGVQTNQEEVRVGGETSKETHIFLQMIR